MVVQKLSEDSITTGPFYVQLLDYLREIAHSINFIAEPAFDYVDNNHKSLVPEQIDELNRIQAKLEDFFKTINRLLNDNNYDLDQIEKAFGKQKDLLSSLNKFRKEQIRRIKAEKVGTRNSVLYLGIINETKNLVLYSGNLLKASRDFTTGNDAGDLENGRFVIRILLDYIVRVSDFFWIPFFYFIFRSRMPSTSKYLSNSFECVSIYSLKLFRVGKHLVKLIF